MFIERALVSLAVAAATMGLAGCDAGSSGGAAAGGAGVTVVDSAGIEIVENHAPQHPPGQFWTLDPEPEFVLGEVEVESGAEADEGRDDRDGRIWQVRGTARLADGRIAVLSQGNHRVFIFEPSGRLSKTIGGRGQGPGEFVRPEHMQYLAPDTLAVWDYWMGPVTYFDTAGTVLDRRPIDLGTMFDLVPGVSEESSTIPMPDGSMVVAINRRDPDFQLPRDGAVVRYPPVEYFRVDLDSYVPRSLGTWDGMEMWLPRKDVQASSDLLSAMGGQLIPTDLMLKSHIAAGGHPPVIYVSNGDIDEIRQFSLDGTLLRIIRRTTPPIVVTARADRARRDNLLPLMDEDGQWSPAVEAWPRRQHHPAIAGLAVDVEGYLWVREWSDSESGMPDQWSVFSPEGRWLGVVAGFPIPWLCYRWPQALPCWIDRDRLLILRPGEFGTETIEGYRIHRDIGEP